ncbi:hypothetical protein BWK63_12055 [Flavobacterium covae]|nr:hypothetical protein BWK63_12055 [Flavobacterium covae]OXA73988.1 hypothetical protein B0A56_13035 [Flavobacterium columnare NBRC 100251 = ATCC 23463]POR20932.1 hypothetical protein BWK57_11890 [Flavobacterium columnare]
MKMFYDLRYSYTYMKKKIILILISPYLCRGFIFRFSDNNEFMKLKKEKICFNDPFFSKMKIDKRGTIKPPRIN